MPLANPYCTVEQVRQELGNTKPEIQVAIEDAINQASRFIDGYKGRDYFFHDYSETPLVVRQFDATFLKSFLYLPYTPIITLTEVVVNGQVWAADERYVQQSTRLVSLNGPWPVKCSTDYVRLTGTFGYAQATPQAVPTGIPGEITRAAILIAAAFSGHNRKQTVGLDGTKQDVIDKEIPRAAYRCLGGRAIPI